MCAIGEGSGSSITDGKGLTTAALEQSVYTASSKLGGGMPPSIALQPSVAVSPSLSDAHPGISQQTVTGGSFVLSGGMPPNIGPRQSIPGTLCMIGGGVPPNIEL